MRFMSRDARKVVDRMESLGIEIEGTQYFQVEVACSMFFPNHIMTVIDKVLSGKNASTKLFKAQDDGWYYFANPVTSMLKGRTTAWQPQAPGEEDMVGWVPEHAAAAYEIVCVTMLPHDMNRTEANQLLYDCPLLAGRDGFIEAIKICKDRNARSIPYLHGILERKAAQVMAYIRERDDATELVWVPDTDVDTIPSDAAAADWERRTKFIKSMRALNAEVTRPRRRT